MGKMRGKKVGVLLGGISKEREISLRSGRAVSKALQRRGMAVVEIDVTERLVDQLREHPIDVAFIALHGKHGEDGTVQGLLEWMRIPYTGCGVMGSSVGMEKIASKALAVQLGMTVAKHQIFDALHCAADQFLQHFTLPLPVIVKPSREGSTINMTIVHKEEELAQALKKATASDHMVLIEEYLEGTEVTVSLLNGKALPLVEIIPSGGFYDYESKYTKGKTEYIVPARLSDETTQELQQISERFSAMIEGSGAMRLDFIVSRQGNASFLEVNTIPGMTELSLVPMAAQKVGIGFDELCEEILNHASLKVMR